MRLKTYLAETGITQTDFARAAGLSKSYVGDLVELRAYPREDVARRIKALTDGQVGPEDFFREDA
jgi:transcriptional regulator with XRE-family HTH domain